MHCPRCTQPLSPVDRGGLVIDNCNQCKGFWLDAGEFEKLVSKKSGLETAPGTVAHTLQSMMQSKRTAMGDDTAKCPRCDAVMSLIRFREGPSQVIADLCPGCKGYWFDAGEMGATFALVKEKQEAVETSESIAIVFFIALSLFLVAVGIGIFLVLT